MATLSIRGMDDDTARLLKEAAQKAGSSVNAQVLELIRRGLGLSENQGRRGHRDLDHLAGTWSEADARDFETTIATFEEVDGDLWR